MRYEQARPQIQTGDAVLVGGGSLVSKLIRLGTAESWSHVGMFVWMDAGLFVAEQTSPMFRIVPASDWMAEHAGERVAWGVAPEKVRAAGEQMKAFALAYRAQPKKKKLYGYLTLPVVWLAQIFGSKANAARTVCSTWLQQAWAQVIDFAKTADPGDIPWYCQSTIPLEV